MRHVLCVHYQTPVVDPKIMEFEVIRCLASPHCSIVDHRECQAVSSFAREDIIVWEVGYS